ncbi:U7 snRNA-associated Sm-like protein LSm11 [Oryzias melastigma]|uniref:U7 snRNA-associated Sm-like protein LSm11 n=1 Tax=Oryzias melastigma TaxID=30732 RepID=A0A834CRI1_ORYME|nr:U7 snRNA-associated Sm-like protein LSm11 [Oryzias melastigma]
MEERERKFVEQGNNETEPTPSTSAEGAVGLDSQRDDPTDKINVCSDNFDPLLALYSPTAPPLPFPNIKCFNNVAEYEGFLKGGRGRAKAENVEKRRQKATKGVADPERIDRLRKLMVVSASEEGEASTTKPRRKQKIQKNVLTRMPLCKGSPLGELHRCIQERIRVKVHIRTFKGLRGVCSGFLVAFDKFWNMAMVDVDETYREPLFGEALYHEKALTISRLFEKLNLQESPGVQEKADKHPPANPRAAPESCFARMEGDGATSESELSEAIKSKQDKLQVSLKAKDPHMRPKGESQKYGKVYTRHINQLFIRGENVILVNPQPL